MVSVMDCNAYDPGSNHNRDKHISIHYALNHIHFTSDESSVELLSHLCDEVKCLAPSTL